MKRFVTVNGLMQKGYRYELALPAGRDFHLDFRPELTPPDMRALGVFCSKYMADTRKEFPARWFTHHRCCARTRAGLVSSHRIHHRAGRHRDRLLRLVLSRSSRGTAMNPRNESCIFCTLPAGHLIAANELAIAVRDKFPVTPMHSLVIPKRHVIDYFDCTAAEREAIHALLIQCRIDILSVDASVKGFNVGANVGKTAGQKIPHVHVHLIPRRSGDIAPPPARP